MHHIASVITASGYRSCTARPVPSHLKLSSSQDKPVGLSTFNTSGGVCPLKQTFGDVPQHRITMFTTHSFNPFFPLRGFSSLVVLDLYPNMHHAVLEPPVTAYQLVKTSTSKVSVHMLDVLIGQWRQPHTDIAISIIISFLNLTRSG